MEADWKKFRAMLPMLRERYLTERNLRITRKLTDPGKSETERFWDAFEEIEKEAKTLRICFDDHSRSKMGHSMAIMRAAGMLKKDDLAGFSEELQQQVFNEPFRKEATPGS